MPNHYRIDIAFLEKEGPFLQEIEFVGAMYQFEFGSRKLDFTEAIANIMWQEINTY